ncbi:hypothetical protein G7046_g7963 [Stylonectria norvegica]|nr:hypothetical protein G7046_g7963 [Stylonectria norvegica]
MRVTALLSALCAAALASADQRTAQIYIEPIHSASKPTHLAEVAYDPIAQSSSSVLTYNAPDLPESAELVRIGIYDAKTSAWTSGTTVASVDNYSKGYSPTLMLTVDIKGDVLSAAVKGVRIDAGQTRDFGPKAVVLVEQAGKQPQLNKPVVLSPGGKKVEEEPEKTLLQKYWWVIGIVVVMTVVGGGDK